MSRNLVEQWLKIKPKNNSRSEMCNTAHRVISIWKNFRALHQRRPENYPCKFLYLDKSRGESVENYKCQSYEELIHLFLFPVWVWMPGVSDIRQKISCEPIPLFQNIFLDIFVFQFNYNLSLYSIIWFWHHIVSSNISDHQIIRKFESKYIRKFQFVQVQ